MRLHFSKMHGLGNDFVVIDNITQSLSLTIEHLQYIADRTRGIGCDQILLVEPPMNPDMDFKYRIFNANGNEVEQCGNGARCFAKFVLAKKLTAKKHINVETCNGNIILTVQDNGHVVVDMGAPEFNPKKIPFIADKKATTYPINANNKAWEIGALSMGNPHAILIVDDVNTAPVKKLGAVIEKHKNFPNRVNVSFLQIIDKHTAKLRVFERGVGETQACGTGACAAAVHGIQLGLLDKEVTLHLTGGALNIRWNGKGKSVMMTGPATHVFDGKINLRDM